MLNSFLSDSASPSNSLWFWNFGSMPGTAMVLQATSGLLLPSYHSDLINYAFYPVVYSSLEVETGFMLRFVHPGGASSLFMSMYIHLGRSLWYKSYKLEYAWLVGVIIFLLSMMVSFLGHVSPRGQMPLWAATVITNPLHVVPYTGENFVEWAWGGLSVGGPTLARFFISHHTLPSMILVPSVVHPGLLHTDGSSNPLGVMTSLDKVELHRSYTLKDMVSSVMAGSLSVPTISLLPHVFTDAENLLFVDSLKTPEHTKPEWYFSFAYCTLRSVPNKVGGAPGLVMSIMVLMLIPYLKKSSMKIQTFMDKFLVVGSMMVLIMLTRSGGCLAEWPYDLLGKSMSVSYFLSMFS